MSILDPGTQPEEGAMPEPRSGSDPRFAPVASPAHTARFVAVLLVVAILIAVRTSHAPAAPRQNHVAQYLILLALEWVLFAFTLPGLRARGTSLRELIGGRWRSMKDILATLLASATFWVTALVVLGGVKRALDLLGQSSLDEA